MCIYYYYLSLCWSTRTCKKVHWWFEHYRKKVFINVNDNCATVWCGHVWQIYGNKYLNFEQRHQSCTIISRHLLETPRRNGAMYQSEYRKWLIQNNWTESDYHIKDKKYLSHTTVTILCAITQFPALPLCGPHINHFCIRLYPKLGHGKCAIQQIPCACVSRTNMLAKPCAPDVAHDQQPCYQPVFEFTYCSVLWTLNNWNII